MLQILQMRSQDDDYFQNGFESSKFSVLARKIFEPVSQTSRSLDSHQTTEEPDFILPEVSSPFRLGHFQCIQSDEETRL